MIDYRCKLGSDAQWLAQATPRDSSRAQARLRAPICSTILGGWHWCKMMPMRKCYHRQRAIADRVGICNRAPRWASQQVFGEAEPVLSMRCVRLNEMTFILKPQISRRIIGLTLPA